MLQTRVFVDNSQTLFSLLCNCQTCLSNDDSDYESFLELGRVI